MSTTPPAGPKKRVGGQESPAQGRRGPIPTITLLPGPHLHRLHHRPPPRTLLRRKAAVWGSMPLCEESGRVENATSRAPRSLPRRCGGRVYQFFHRRRAARRVMAIAMAWRAVRAGLQHGDDGSSTRPGPFTTSTSRTSSSPRPCGAKGGHLLPPRKRAAASMVDYDPERMELARAMWSRARSMIRIKRFGLDYVHLDISHQPAEFVKGHFPTIYDKLNEPRHRHDGASRSPSSRHSITPAAGWWWESGCAHRCAGAVGGGRMHREAGCTARTGLASNSLLECFVFGEAAARDILERWDSLEEPPRNPAVGRKPRDRFGRGSRHQARTGPKSAASCGTMSASCAPPSGWNAPSTASSC